MNVSIVLFTADPRLHDHPPPQAAPDNPHTAAPLTDQPQTTPAPEPTP
ncbi:hypothetical protein [Streptomyces broussonetiae]|uniref:Uncharacterized protein n=1 Tax=Streptomyces broussonetiae TaxID=2686304 RepID=A0ABV5EC92_9ACTN